MENFLEKALEKLTEGVKADCGKHGNAMKKEVAKALEDFCRQDAEFAQAVAQGGDFKGCMEAVSKGVGQSISDLDAYKRAVEFYFPGAGISFSMTIDLCASVRKDEPEEKAGLVLDLSAFF